MSDIDLPLNFVTRAFGRLYDLPLQIDRAPPAILAGRANTTNTEEGYRHEHRYR
jgi:hypothetical protein